MDDDPKPYLWDGGDGERHSDLKVKGALGEVELDVDGPVGVLRRRPPREEELVVHEPHEQTDGADKTRELVPELVQLLLQRGVFLLLCGGLNLRLNTRGP